MAIAKQLQPKTALLFSKADRFELSLCQLMNRMGYNRSVRLFFKGISRAGDGEFWYVLGLLLPLIFGIEGLAALGHMAITGLLCVGIYSQLKNRLVRQRPYISFAAIQAHTAPLDLYSFPSGHTMNAVNFTVLISFFFPLLFWVVAPFALLVALSRVILGMHYPTDVLVGASLGMLLSYGSLAIWPAGMFAFIIY
ncbi:MULTISPECIES: phosphatase PAP2 family protein [Oceanospirillaceae]|uniref:undecaprenyl-diphosphate phosphatase n=1 Tax=Oceanobacter antarcticus TaxID=3133425 RepID=A0ABW8ND96_9GAMM